MPTQVPKLRQVQADLKPTNFQQKIADDLEVDISSDTRRIAAARLLDRLEPAINPKVRSQREATDRQIEYADSLGMDVRGESVRVAGEMIAEQLYRQNQKAIEDLGLELGVRVNKPLVVEVDGEVHRYDREYTVSSIGDNLMVYFKGGGGQCAWPSQLERLDE